MKRVSTPSNVLLSPLHPHDLHHFVMAAGRRCCARAPHSEGLFSPVMYCTDPGEVEHSTRLISDPVLLVGTTIQYTCNPGFVLEGSSLLTCYSRETGTPIWTSRLPHCVCKFGQFLLLSLHLGSSAQGSQEALSSGRDLPQLCGAVQSFELPESGMG